jgi:hypothetical protein
MRSSPVGQLCALTRRIICAMCKCPLRLSDHPPANLLAALARILNVSVEQFLSNGPVTRKTRTTLSPRLQRQLKQIERLSAKPKQQQLSIIDTFIEAEQNRNASRS